MHSPSNLPPNVTDRMIEEQANGRAGDAPALIAGGWECGEVIETALQFDDRTASGQFIRMRAMRRKR